MICNLWDCSGNDGVILDGYQRCDGPSDADAPHGGNGESISYADPKVVKSGKDESVGLTKAMRNTESASEVIIMPSFQPEGYSGSSERLSEACASSEGDVSTVLGSLSCWEFSESDVSFSA